MIQKVEILGFTGVDIKEFRFQGPPRNFTLDRPRYEFSIKFKRKQFIRRPPSIPTPLLNLIRPICIR